MNRKGVTMHGRAGETYEDRCRDVNTDRIQGAKRCPDCQAIFIPVDLERCSPCQDDRRQEARKSFWDQYPVSKGVAQ